MPYSKVKSLKIKEEISKELYRGRSVESMDFKQYKKITCISTKPPSSIQQEYIQNESQLPEEIVEIQETPPEIYHQQKIQKITDLRKILDYDQIVSSQQLSFLNDSDVQVVTIQEPSSEEIILF